jgi:hypothetical protein
LDDGTYGRCDRCGGAIPPERLAVEPEAIWCVRCANVMDPAYVPPARALAAQTGEQPPGVRDPVEATRRDFADALWQFGSSDSPQDLPDVVSYEDIGDTLGPPPGGVAAIETYVDEAGEVLQDTVRALPRRQGRSTQKASAPDGAPFLYGDHRRTRQSAGGVARHTTGPAAAGRRSARAVWPRRPPPRRPRGAVASDREPEPRLSFPDDARSVSRPGQEFDGRPRMSAWK